MSVKFALEQISALEELHALVGEYYERYMQDEADDATICFDDRQHILAGAIRDKLNELQAVTADNG
jgi:hypothetical protein